MEKKQSYFRVMITTPLLAIVAGSALIFSYWNEPDIENARFGIAAGIIVFLGGFIWLMSSYYALKEDWERENGSHNNKKTAVH